MSPEEPSHATTTKLHIQHKVWRHKTPSGWHFITLTESESEFLDNLTGLEIVGLGYVKVTAKLGDTEWQTTLFPDKSGRYLLAIKAAVRKQEAVVEGGIVDIELTFETQPGPTPPPT